MKFTGVPFEPQDPAAGLADRSHHMKYVEDLRPGDPKRVEQLYMAAVTHLRVSVYPELPPALIDENLQQAQRLLVRATEEPEFSRYARMDDVLFALAMVSGRRGDDQDMRKAFMLLIRDVPQSRWVPMAYLSFGDHFFDAGDCTAAGRFYEKASMFDEPGVAAYAHYRWAWCGLSAKPEADPTQSLEHFVAAIESAMASLDADAPSSNGLEPRQILTAARRELVLAYAEVGKPSRAKAFFVRVGRGPGDEDLGAEMLLRLAVVYRARDEREHERLICGELERMASSEAMRCS